MDFDLDFEAKKARSLNGTCPGDLLQRTVAGTSSLVCSDLQPTTVIITVLPQSTECQLIQVETSLIVTNKVNELKRRINNCFHAEIIITSNFKSQIQEEVKWNGLI